MLTMHNHFKRKIQGIKILMLHAHLHMYKRGPMDMTTAAKSTRPLPRRAALTEALPTMHAPMATVAAN